jgi:hypothetical protein
MTKPQPMSIALPVGTGPDSTSERNSGGAYCWSDSVPASSARWPLSALRTAQFPS